MSNDTIDTPPAKPEGATAQPLSRTAGSPLSRKERAWRRYKQSECFDADGKANAFSKGFDAGEVITPDKWNDLLGERDHLRDVIVRAAHKFREDKNDSVIAAEMIMILQEANT